MRADVVVGKWVGGFEGLTCVFWAEIHKNKCKSRRGNGLAPFLVAAFDRRGFDRVDGRSLTPRRSNFSGDIMANPAPLSYVIYIAAPPEKVWEGFVSPESNRILFMGAELEADWRAGGSMAWVGPGPDGKPMKYVHGEVLRFDPPKVLQYTFAMGQSDTPSRVTVELVPETEATKVTVTHDQWAEGDSAYAATADGWSRILSRLKTLIETGKTFKPH